MTALTPFSQRRRQQFLSEKMYQRTLANQQQLVQVEKDNLSASGADAEANATTRQLIYLEQLWIWMLEYTAGREIRELAREFSPIVNAFAEWNDAYQIYLQELSQEFPEDGNYSYSAAPDFTVLGDYVDTLQLLSIGILIRDRKSVDKIIEIMRSHRGQDALFEELVDMYATDSHRTDRCVFDSPFDTLTEAFVAENDSEVVPIINRYLSAWYPAMRDHPRWYDGHLSITDEGLASYYGYWSFEAAAAAYILDVDGNQIRNLSFPNDLLDFGNRLRDADI